MAYNVSITNREAVQPFLDKIVEGHAVDHRMHLIYTGDSYAYGRGAYDQENDSWPAYVTRAMKRVARRDGGKYIYVTRRRDVWNYESGTDGDKGGWGEKGYEPYHWYDGAYLTPGWAGFSGVNSWAGDGGFNGLWLSCQSAAAAIERNTAYALNVYKQISGYLWKCTTDGTTHATTAPTWSTAYGLGDTITDGTVVWTNWGKYPKRIFLPPARHYDLIGRRYSTGGKVDINFAQTVPGFPYTLDCSGGSDGYGYKWTLPDTGEVKLRQMTIQHNTGSTYFDGVLCRPDDSGCGLIDYRVGISGRSLWAAYEAIGLKPARENSKVYALHSYVTVGGYQHRCTTAGTSAASDPGSWATTVGATTTDGTVTWTCVGVAASATRRREFVGANMIPASEPVMVVIELGVNDDRGSTPASVQTPLQSAQFYLSDLMSAYQEYFTDVYFVYVSPAPYSSAGRPTTADSQYNYHQSLGKTAVASSTRCAWVDLSQSVGGGTATEAFADGYFCGDLLHPSSAGHSAYGESVVQALQLPGTVDSATNLSAEDLANIREQIDAAIATVTPVDDRLEAIEKALAPPKRVTQGIGVPRRVTTYDEDGATILTDYDVTMSADRDTITETKRD